LTEELKVKKALNKNKRGSIKRKILLFFLKINIPTMKIKLKNIPNSKEKNLSISNMMRISRAIK
ncbi:MAG: hypothetical protein Q4P79_08005, partial [Fusobacterium sp.]